MKTLDQFLDFLGKNGPPEEVVLSMRDYKKLCALSNQPAIPARIEQHFVDRDGRYRSSTIYPEPTKRIIDLTGTQVFK